ncbi:MAG: GNAT family N-acetyltransferase [Chloroflexales bacterium]|nr:GNAT family N-acetyltransferase [Chloroflexales bacterium]
MPTIASLLVELYAAELPGALRGPPAGQTRLLAFTLAAKQGQGLRGRLVAVEKAGAIIGTAAFDRPDAPPYERAPDGTVRHALQELGAGPTARLLLTVARSLIGVQRPSMADAVGVHSVVVDSRHRGQGVGRALMVAVEDQARQHGFQAAWLQVLTQNQPARQLYERLGYTEVWASPRWAQLLTWPSAVLGKQLT